jgi:hypothetical protein
MCHPWCLVSYWQCMPCSYDRAYYNVPYTRLAVHAWGTPQLMLCFGQLFQLLVAGD